MLQEPRRKIDNITRDDASITCLRGIVKEDPIRGSAPKDRYVEEVCSIPHLVMGPGKTASDSHTPPIVEYYAIWLQQQQKHKLPRPLAARELHLYTY